MGNKVNCGLQVGEGVKERGRSAEDVPNKRPLVETCGSAALFLKG